MELLKLYVLKMYCSYVFKALHFEQEYINHRSLESQKVLRVGLTPSWFGCFHWICLKKKKRITPDSSLGFIKYL